MCETAIGIDGGNNPLAVQERETKRETVGPVTVEYMDGALSSPYVAAAESKLTKLVKSGSSSINAVVTRA